MPSSCVILWCSIFFCHVTLGYDTARYGVFTFAKLEAKEEENHVLNGRIVKRAIDGNNEIGGNNDNDNNHGGPVTTTDSNAVEYSAPEADNSDNISMKSMFTEASGGVNGPTNSSNTETTSSTVSKANANDMVNTTSADVADVINTEMTSSNTTSAILSSISNETTTQNIKDVNHTTTAVVNENNIDNPDKNGTNVVNTTAAVGQPSSSTLSSALSASENTNMNNSATTPGSPDYNTIPSTQVTKSQNTSMNNSDELLSTNTMNVTTQSNNIPETSISGILGGSNGVPSDEHSTHVTEEPKPNTTTGVKEVSKDNFTKSTDDTTSDTDITEPKPNTTAVPVIVTTSIPSVTTNSSVISESSTNASLNASSVTESVAVTSVIPKSTTSASSLLNESSTDKNNQTISEPQPSVTPNATLISEANTSILNEQNETTTIKITSQTSTSSNVVTNSTTLTNDITIEPTVLPEVDNHTESILITNATGATGSSGNLSSVKPSPDSETDTAPEPSPEPWSNSTEAPVNASVGPTSVHNPTTSPTSMNNATDLADRVNVTVSSNETDQRSSVGTKPAPETTKSPKTTVITVKPTREPERNTTNTADTGDNTSPEPTSEPTDGKDSNDEPEPKEESDPENEPDSEPEGEEEPEPESELDAFAEPGPDWVLAKEVWQEAWEFHVYFFGIAFALLGFYCFIALIRLWDMEHLISKHYFVTLNVLVILVCILRATYLLLDAYNSLGTFPVGVDYFMYSTAFPCLTAMFSILFYSLLLATRVRVMSKKVQKLWVLLVIVILHFALSIVTDIVVGFLSSASVLILVCQVFFIVWGLLMFIGYLILFRKLYKGAIHHQKTMAGLHEHKSPVLHGHGHQSKPKHKYTFGLAVKITFISAFFGVAMVGFELYGIFGVYGALSTNTKPEPWPWWTYHVIVRTLEFLMCLSVTFVASQPLRYKLKKKSNRSIYHYILPCSMCCCPSSLEHHETFSSSGSMDCIVSESDHLSWLKKIKNKKVPSPQAPYPPHTAEKYSDPDATLLVRKVKRVNKPSMLVVEDGFVRIRRDDEVLPSNQFELDTYSQSSHSSGNNINGLENVSNTGAINNIVNLNYTGHSGPNGGHANVPGLNFDNYILQGSVAQSGTQSDVDINDDTDIEIVVTESEQESDEPGVLEGAASGESNKSADIFRPLSMIDFAASMESELDRAFHSSCVEETDLISHNSLPASLEGCSSDSNAYNEPMYKQYFENEGMASVSYHDSNNYSSDSTESKSSATKLLHSPVRRCKSEDSATIAPPKCKHFEKNKYFSLSRVDTIAQEDIKYTEL